MFRFRFKILTKKFCSNEIFFQPTEMVESRVYQKDLKKIWNCPDAPFFLTLESLMCTQETTRSFQLFCATLFQTAFLIPPATDGAARIFLSPYAMVCSERER